MNSRRKAAWLLGLILVAGMGVYAWHQGVWQTLQNLSPLYVVGVGLLQVGTLAACIWQWQFLLVRAGGRIGFWDCARAYMAGSFVESVTPSVKFGGEAVKLYLYRRWSGIPAAALTGVLVAQKLLLLTPFLVLTAVLLAVYAHLLSLASGRLAIIGGLALLSIFGILLLVRPPAVLQRFSFAAAAWQTAKTIAQGRRAVLLAVSTGIWVLYPVKAYALAVWGFGLDVPFAVVAVAVLAAYLAGMVPLLPGGLGAFEGTMALVLTAGGLTTSEALLVALALRTFTFWLPLVAASAAAACILPRISRWSDKEMSHG